MDERYRKVHAISNTHSLLQAEESCKWLLLLLYKTKDSLQKANIKLNTWICFQQCYQYFIINYQYRNLTSRVFYVWRCVMEIYIDEVENSSFDIKNSLDTGKDPHLITQEELNVLIKNLSKYTPELLESRLWGWNLLLKKNNIAFTEINNRNI